jgi:hypothetical protein
MDFLIGRGPRRPPRVNAIIYDESLHRTAKRELHINVLSLNICGMRHAPVW